MHFSFNYFFQDWHGFKHIYASFFFATLKFIFKVLFIVIFELHQQKFIILLLFATFYFSNLYLIIIYKYCHFILMASHDLEPILHASGFITFFAIFRSAELKLVLPVVDDRNMSYYWDLKPS
jgi:hypothetical protein